MSNKVFISYSHADKTFVDWLINELGQHQVNLWYDNDEIKAGDSIKKKIEEGIEASSTIIIVFSKNSINSDWVQFEYNSALLLNSIKKGIKVITLVIDDVELPSNIAETYLFNFSNKNRGLVLSLLLKELKSNPLISYPKLDWSRLSPRNFEDLVFDLMVLEGFDLIKTPRTRDSGIDFIGHVKGDDGADQRILIECKFYGSNKISIDILRTLHAISITENAKAVYLITNSELTKSSRNYIANKNFDLIVWEEQLLLSKLYSHPELIEKYFSLKPLKPTEQVKLIDKEFVEMQKLMHELDSCPEGKLGWKQYENICIKILCHLFVPSLSEPKIQSRRENEIDIRDAIFPNRGKNENWKFIREDYDAKYVVFEFKNYSDDGSDIDKYTVLQIGDYMKKTIGRFGIVCSRKPPVNSALEKRKDFFIEQNKLIIFLTNDHLKEMLIRKYNKQDPSDVITDLIDDFNITF